MNADLERAVAEWAAAKKAEDRVVEQMRVAMKRTRSAEERMRALAETGESDIDVGTLDPVFRVVRP